MPGCRDRPVCHGVEGIEEDGPITATPTAPPLNMPTMTIDTAGHGTVFDLARTVSLICTTSVSIRSYVFFLQPEIGQRLSARERR